MPLLSVTNNRPHSARFYKRLVSSASLLLVFFAVVYEFPASVVVEVWSSYGVVNSSGFIKFRLFFAALVIAVCTLNLILNFKGILKTREFRVYIFIYCVMLVIVWLNRGEYAFMTVVDVHTISAYDYWTPKFFKYLLFFLIGLQLVNLSAFRYLLLLSWILSGLVVLQYVDYELLGLNRRDFVVGANKGVYLFLGDAFALTSLLTFALFKNNFVRFYIFIFSAVVIFFIGSRTSFIVFTFVIFLYYILLFRLKWLPFYLITCVTLVGVGSTLDFNELAETNRRMVGVFVDFEEDNSVQGRRQLTERGWEDILDNPVFGRFGGQRDSGVLFEKEDWNSYMHNIFSYWRQFGIFVFFPICYIYYRFGRGVFSMLSSKQSQSFRVYFLMGAFITVESLFSRSFAFAATHMIFGMSVSLYLNNALGLSKLSNTKQVTSSATEDNASPNRRRRRKRRKKHHSGF